EILGVTAPERYIEADDVKIALEDALKAWTEPFQDVFPELPRHELERQITVNRLFSGNESGSMCGKMPEVGKSSVTIAKPRIFIPVFPGTNCEYDSEKEFTDAGGIVDIMVVRNMTANDIEYSISTIVEKIKKSQIIMLPGGFSAGDEPDGSGKFIAAVFRNAYIAEAIMELLKSRDGLMLGICNGFQALIKLGLLPYGEIKELAEDSPTLTFNTIGRHVSCMAHTKVISKISPWLSNTQPGEIYTIPVSHGEGRFVAGIKDIEKMAANCQIATQYVDLDGNPTYDPRYNINGSVEAIEGITSPDGRIFGKMAHSERISENTARNVPGIKNQYIFKAGVQYFS
ncbi:MAG: phosphoribosylformylglycinamidine synthase subunit PurQ, partial [Eubacteriales bacterium]|nr:phosphoribosylformylglycinamidine synthase subunit PurQ [Eubacteriales bacterium]